MKQYRITSADLTFSGSDDCVLSDNDPARELIGHPLLNHVLSTSTDDTETAEPVVNKGRIQREQQIKPGTDAWFKLWFSNPGLTNKGSL